MIYPYFTYIVWWGFLNRSQISPTELHRPVEIFLGVKASYDHMIDYENVFQAISYQTHQLSWSYDNYWRAQPIWSKKFISLPKKKTFKNVRIFYALPSLKMLRKCIWQILEKWIGRGCYLSQNLLSDFNILSPRNPKIAQFFLLSCLMKDRWKWCYRASGPLTIGDASLC